MEIDSEGKKLVENILMKTQENNQNKSLQKKKKAGSCDFPNRKSFEKAGFLLQGLMSLKNTFLRRSKLVNDLIFDNLIKYRHGQRQQILGNAQPCLEHMGPQVRIFLER